MFPVYPLRQGLLHECFFFLYVLRVVVLNKEECTYYSCVCCIIELTWILISHSFSGAGVSLACITLCWVLWDTEIRACIYLPTLHVFTKSLQSYDKLQFKMCHKGVVHGHLPLEFRAGEKIGWKDLRRPCQVDDIWTGPPRINGIWLGRRKREHPEQTQEETGRRPGWCEVGVGVTRGSQTVWVLECRLTRFFLQIRGCVPVYVYACLQDQGLQL